MKPVFRLASALLLAASLSSAWALELNIGYQKSAINLASLKRRACWSKGSSRWGWR